MAAQIGIEPRPFDDDALGAPVALYRDGHGKEVEVDRHRFGDRIRRELPQMRHRLAHAGFEQRVVALVGQIGGVDARAGAFEMAQLAQLLRCHRDLVRAAAAENVDVPDIARREQVARMGDDVAASELGGSLGEDARDIERDIAIADHRDAGAVERRVEVGEIGVAIVPADEGGAADDAGQIGAGYPQRPVIGRPGREHDGVVELRQFVDPDVGADRHMADEAHIV